MEILVVLVIAASVFAIWLAAGGTTDNEIMRKFEDDNE